jgi:hypothetical protein
LADGAQPCAEPHGFVAVFDWFDLVFMQKLKNCIAIIQS